MGLVDSGGAVKLGPGLSFSWKRALGVTKAKRRVSKKTGIPLSRGGRRMKLGKWMRMKKLRFWSVAEPIF